MERDTIESIELMLAEGHMTAYSLANILFSFDGEGALVQALRDGFGGIQQDAAGKAIHIRFCFVEALPKMGDYVSLPPFKAGEGLYQADLQTLSCQVRAREPGFEVDVHVRDDLAAAEVDTVVAEFMSGVFEPLTQFIHLQNNTTYLAASSLERDGRAVALVGWGEGEGDDSAALIEQMSEDGWRFLSDGLGLINRDGILSPRGTLGATSGSPLSTVSAPGAPTKLTDLYFIERANVSSFKQRSASVGDVARQSVAVLLRRLRPCMDHATALHGGSYYPMVPRPDDFYQRCFNITRQGFAAQGPVVIRTPLEAGADALAKFLRRKLGS